MTSEGCGLRHRMLGKFVLEMQLEEGRKKMKTTKANGSRNRKRKIIGR